MFEYRKKDFIPKKEVKGESKEGIMKWVDNSASKDFGQKIE